jgi:N-acetylneuraminate synthase
MNAYIIGEIGINYNGSLENCFKLIDAAAVAGCNAAKFQFYRAKYLYPKTAGSLDWKSENKEYDYDIYSASEQFELSEEWIEALTSKCESNNIDFLCSVFDEKGLHFLIKKGLKKIKLASTVITNLPLIELCAGTGLPIIMSVGGATLSEIEDAVSIVLKHHNNLSLLHCSLKYPTELKECNMGVLQTLRMAFPHIAVGWSDHTMEVSDAPVQAVYLGAQIIEKHITLSKKMEGPDHFFALEPDELKKMVYDIRQAELTYKNGNYEIDKTIYGSSAKAIQPYEKYLRDFAFMRLYAKNDIKEGSVINTDDISILRPGKKEHGLEPKYLKLFKEHTITAKKDITCEDPITWDAILA